MIAQLVKNFKFEPSEEEIAWEVGINSLHTQMLTPELIQYSDCAQSFGIQCPYLKKDQDDPDRLPKLLLKVIEL
jgi:hypothetical protein